MALNIDADVSESIWKEYDNDVSIKIRPLTPEYVRESRKKYTKKSTVQRGLTVDNVNEDKWDAALTDHMVDDWKGIVDKEGNPVPCELIAKKKLLDKFPDLANWIFKTARELAEELATVKGEQLKN